MKNNGAWSGKWTQRRGTSSAYGATSRRAHKKVARPGKRAGGKVNVGSVYFNSQRMGLILTSSITFPVVFVTDMRGNTYRVGKQSK